MQGNEVMPLLLTIRQPAAELKVSRNTMRAMIADGRAIAINIARPGALQPTWRIRAERLKDLPLKALEEKISGGYLDEIIR